jgi:hypothetical protein
MYCIPSWMGYTKYNWDTDIAVYHLIPFNRIIRLFIDILQWIRHGKYEKDGGKRQEISKRSYDRGFKDGKAEGIREWNSLFKDTFPLKDETKTP